MPEIANQFRALKKRLRVVLPMPRSSVPSPSMAAALAELAAQLEKRFARKLHLNVQLDPELIGGVRVVVGDEVLDTSVKARLEQMKAALTA